MASMSGAFGFPDPTPVGLHRKVYTSPMWSVRLWRGESCFMDQILAVQSSEQEARSAPLLSHCTQLTPFYEGRGERLCSYNRERVWERSYVVNESVDTA